MTEKYEYDVALSFLAQDEPIAQALANALRERFRFFIYSERQKELAGKDGLEEFAKVFRDQARVCVILHRNGWGKTKWTRVEETAIKDRAFDRGWDFLTVIALDNSQPPPWLPRTKIWYGFERFGLAAAVGVIDARVQEQGGEVVEETARDRAARLARETELLQERERLLGSVQGVEMARQQVAKLFSHLEKEVAAITAESRSADMRFVKKDRDVVGVLSRRGSVTFGWAQQYSNSLQYASLFVREFDGLYSFDGIAGGPNVLREVHIEFTLDEAGNPAWREEDDPARLYGTVQLAERYLKRILDRIYARQ